VVASLALSGGLGVICLLCSTREFFRSVNPFTCKATIFKKKRTAFIIKEVASVGRPGVLFQHLLLVLCIQKTPCDIGQGLVSVHLGKGCGGGGVVRDATKKGKSAKTHAEVGALLTVQQSG